MNRDLYEFLLKAIGHWWTHSVIPYSHQQSVRTTKPRARAIAVRYFLTYSGKGL